MKNPEASKTVAGHRAEDSRTFESFERFGSLGSRIRTRVCEIEEDSDIETVFEFHCNSIVVEAE